MAEISHVEVQGEATQSFFDVMQAISAIYVFEDVSCTSPGILEKPERVNTQAMDKPKNYRDQSLIKEEWDNIHDPILANNPKSLREVAYERMKKISDPNSLAQNLWFSRLPQYMVSFVHSCSELVDLAIEYFNPRTDTIEGWDLKVNICLGAIWNMLCIPDQSSRAKKIEPFNLAKGEEIWRTRQKALDFYIKETQRPKED